MIDPTATIHPQAWVDDTVSIGARTKVWQFASITRGTIIGEDSNIWPSVVLDGSVYGNQVKISSGFVAGSGFKVGNRVFIGPSVVLANDMFPFVHRDGYDDTKLRGNEQFSVIIEDDVCLGAHCVVLPGTRIGAGSIIAAGAIVDRSVPAGVLLQRNGYSSPIRPGLERKRMRCVS